MIELDIPLDIIGKARKLSDELGVLKHSITKGKGNLYGFIGELIFNSIVKGKLKSFRGSLGKRSDYKKAFVTLEDGQTIDINAGA